MKAVFLATFVVAQNFRVSTQSLTWVEALEACRGYNTELARITSKKDAVNLSQQVTDRN
jgi:hypothetical protein